MLLVGDDDDRGRCSNCVVVSVAVVHVFYAVIAAAVVRYCSLIARTVVVAVVVVAVVVLVVGVRYLCSVCSNNY